MSLNNLRTDQFKYTKFWNELIIHVKKIMLSNHKILLKTYKDCFTGHAMTTHILDYLSNNNNVFAKNLSRNNAVKIGTIIMKQNVFIPINTDEFYDDPKKLYELVNNLDEPDNNIELADNDFLVRDKIIVRLLTLVDVPVLETLLDWDTIQRKIMVKTLVNHESPANSSMCNFVPNHDAELADEWSSCALKVLNNVYIYDNLSDNINDDFEIRGYEKSDQINRIKMSESELILKIQLFHTISDYYCTSYVNKQPSSALKGKTFFPIAFNDIFQSVLTYIMERRYRIAISIIQLTLALLHPKKVKEILCLFEFIRAVSNANDIIRLESDISNIELCLKKFSPCFFDAKHFTPEQSQIIVSFMLNNIHLLHGKCDLDNDMNDLSHKSLSHIFNSLSGLTLDPSAKTQNTMTNGLSNPNSSLSTTNCNTISFCEKLSQEIYNAQTNASTQNELYKLLADKIEDLTLTDKEKKKFVKRFQQCHPDIYREYLSYNGHLDPLSGLHNVGCNADTY